MIYRPPRTTIVYTNMTTQGATQSLLHEISFAQISQD